MCELCLTNVTLKKIRFYVLNSNSKSLSVGSIDIQQQAQTGPTCLTKVTVTGIIFVPCQNLPVGIKVFF